MTNGLIEDFNYVINTIKETHPSGVSGFGSNFETDCNKLRESIIDRDSLISVLGRLTAGLKDGHTNIELPTKKKRSVP